MPDGTAWEACDWDALFQAVDRFSTLQEICGLESQNLTSVEEGLFVRVMVQLERVNLHHTKVSVGQMTSLLKGIAEEESRLKTLILHRQDLSNVYPDLLARAVTRLEDMDFSIFLGDKTMNTEQIAAILTYIVREDTKLKKLILDGHDLSNVEPEALARALIKLEEVSLGYAKLITAQVNCFLTSIAQEDLKLKKLKLLGNDLHIVESEVLTKAMVRLDQVNLNSTKLRIDQIISILTSISQFNTKLKCINLRHNDLSLVEPEIVSEAVTKLEKVNLCFTTLNTEQITSILKNIAKEQSTLKKLNLGGEDLSKVEPEVLSGAVLKLEGVDLEEVDLDLDILEICPRLNLKF